jgi:hypothetical protein
MTFLDKKALVDLHRTRAGHYDVTANLYYLIGFREMVYRFLGSMSMRRRG